MSRSSMNLRSCSLIVSLTSNASIRSDRACVSKRFWIDRLPLLKPMVMSSPDRASASANGFRPTPVTSMCSAPGTVEGHHATVPVTVPVASASSELVADLAQQRPAVPLVILVLDAQRRRTVDHPEDPAPLLRLGNEDLD